MASELDQFSTLFASERELQHTLLQLLSKLDGVTGVRPYAPATLEQAGWRHRCAASSGPYGARQGYRLLPPESIWGEAPDRMCRKEYSDYRQCRVKWRGAHRAPSVPASI